MVTRTHFSICLPLASLLLGACVEPQAAPASQAQEPLPAFAMAYSARAEVRLMAGDVPLRNAVIQIRRIDKSGLAQRGVVALMRTDEEGRALGYMSLVRGEGKLEMIVIKPGLRGPYTPAENQGAPGAHAPAARLEVDPSDLARGVQLDLDREKGT